MAECRNCGHHVSAEYVRVRSIDDRPGVAICPHCPDKTWADGRPRDARSPAAAGSRSGTGDREESS